MNISFEIPELNIKEDEIKLLLSLKLFEEDLISLGKAAEIAGYSEKAYSEILIRKGVSPMQYSDIDPIEEAENA